MLKIIVLVILIPCVVYTTLFMATVARVYTTLVFHYITKGPEKFKFWFTAAIATWFFGPKRARKWGFVK